ncbi:hypothetical protein [Luteimonas lutimaris]|uniref:Uncharacterized protein n=1 Tax=Luteimonas lutimaris TaxID=698645 RepID=A0ABP7M2Y1_9GAMM
MDKQAECEGQGRWIPRSGYGKYCTIPISDGAGVDQLSRCGLGSFTATRRDMQGLADEYIEQAVELVARARQERLRLSREIRGPSGERLIRPYRCRIWLDLDKADCYMYLGWRGIATKGRTRTKWLWDCRADIAPWLKGVHEAEAQLIREVEAKATEIRLRWFALVRAMHYMNEVERFGVDDWTASGGNGRRHAYARRGHWFSRLFRRPAASESTTSAV